jgi:hypothetical protein
MDSGPTNWDLHFGHTATWSPWVPPPYKLLLYGGDSTAETGFCYEGVSTWNTERFNRSLQLAAAEAMPDFSDFLSGLFSLLDVNPAEYLSDKSDSRTS